MPQVQIRVKGRIDAHWSEWFEGLTIASTEENDTILTGSVVDQSALYGLLAKLRDLGLQLLAVRCEDIDEWEAAPADGSDWPDLGPQSNGKE